MIIKLIVPLQLVCILVLGIRLMTLTEEKRILKKVLKEDQRLIFKLAKKIERLQKKLNEED